jgi:chromosome partitioning protein
VGQVLAIANDKGGVAKTTTAVHLSAALAHQDRHVLLVDLDAQGQASGWWLDQVDGDLQHAITGRVPATQLVLRTRVPGLDLLPGSLALVRLGIELARMDDPEAQAAVARALAPLRPRYDLLVLDTAPSLTLLNLAALAAADALLIPTTPTLLSAQGLGSFLDWVAQFRAQGTITAVTLGLLLCMVDVDRHGRPRTRIGRETAAALAAVEGLPLLGVVVPRRIGVEDLAEQRLVVGDRQARALVPDVVDAYQRLATEVLARLARVGVAQ